MCYGRHFTRSPPVSFVVSRVLSHFFQFRLFYSAPSDTAPGVRDGPIGLHQDLYDSHMGSVSSELDRKAKATPKKNY